MKSRVRIHVGANSFFPMSHLFCSHKEVEVENVTFKDWGVCSNVTFSDTCQMSRLVTWINERGVCNGGREESVIREKKNR